MIIAIWRYIALMQAGFAHAAREWLPHVRPWQIGPESFVEFSPHCPDRICGPMHRRPANALNIEVGSEPRPRCVARTPKEWGDADPMGARWRQSGGHFAVFGECKLSRCHRARK